jgi:hypothetical protein
MEQALCPRVMGTVGHCLQVHAEEIALLIAKCEMQAKAKSV